MPAEPPRRSRRVNVSPPRSRGLGSGEDAAGGPLDALPEDKPLEQSVGFEPDGRGSVPIEPQHRL